MALWAVLAPLLYKVMMYKRCMGTQSNATDVIVSIFCLAVKYDLNFAIKCLSNVNHATLLHQLPQA